MRTTAYAEVCWQEVRRGKENPPFLLHSCLCLLLDWMSILTLSRLLSLLAIFVFTAQACGDETDKQNPSDILTKNQNAIVVITSISTVSIDLDDGTSLKPSTQQRRSLGTILDETGILVTAAHTHDATQGIKKGARVGENRRAGVESVRQERERFDLSFGDGRTMEAVFLYEDKAADLLFLQATPPANAAPEAKVFEFISFDSVIVDPQIGDPTYGISRASASFEFIPMLLPATLSATYSADRTYHLMAGQMVLGIPVLNKSGGALGLVVKRFSPITDGSSTGVLDRSHIQTNLIIARSLVEKRKGD